MSAFIARGLTSIKQEFGDYTHILSDLNPDSHWWKDTVINLLYSMKCVKYEEDCCPFWQIVSFKKK